MHHLQAAVVTQGPMLSLQKGTGAPQLVLSISAGPF